MRFSLTRLATSTVLAATAVVMAAPAAEAQETNVEAVTRRLIDAVRRGELHPETAAEMVAVMARHSFHLRLERGPQTRRRAEDSRRRYQQREQAPRRPQPQARRGDDRARSRTTDHTRELMAYYQRLGVDGATFGKLRGALVEYGLPRAKADDIMRAVARIAAGMRQQGDSYRRSDEMAKFLHENLGLNREQIQLVEALAQRVAHGMGRATPQRRAPDRRRETDRPKQAKTDDAEAARQARYRAFEKRVHEAVKQGKMSKSEAARYLDGVKKRLWPDGGAKKKAAKSKKAPKSQKKKTTKKRRESLPVARF